MFCFLYFPSFDGKRDCFWAFIDPAQEVCRCTDLISNGEDQPSMEGETKRYENEGDA